jgi:hypothetical protein
MPISWLTVLQVVPWSEVIANAPKVAEGAKKLWGTVGRKTGPAEVATPADSQALSSDARSVAALRGQVASLETAVTDLQAQMLASSELIKDLAEQNAQLIARVDANRRRAIWLAGGLAVTMVVAATCLVLLVAQPGA